MTRTINRNIAINKFKRMDPAKKDVSTETVWQNYHKELRAFIFSRIKNEEATQDLLQELFMKIHLNLSFLKDPTSVRSWVYQIARNLLNDHFRKNSAGRQKQ